MSAQPKLVLEYVSPWLHPDVTPPDDGQTVLCYWKAGNGFAASMESLTFHACDSYVDGHESWIDVWGEKRDTPDRWMPLPEAP